MDYPVRTAEQLANILKGVRGSRGLTQQALADRVGLLQKAISAVEHHPEKSSVARLFQLLAGLELELVLRDRQPGAAAKPADW